MLQIQKISKLVVAGLVSGLFCLNYVCPQVIMRAGEVGQEVLDDTVKTKGARKARFKKMIKKIAAAGGITVATAGILAYYYYYKNRTRADVSLSGQTGAQYFYVPNNSTSEPTKLPLFKKKAFTEVTTRLSSFIQDRSSKLQKFVIDTNSSEDMLGAGAEALSWCTDCSEDQIALFTQVAAIIQNVDILSVKSYAAQQKEARVLLDQRMKKVRINRFTMQAGQGTEKPQDLMDASIKLQDQILAQLSIHGEAIALKTMRVSENDLFGIDYTFVIKFTPTGVQTPVVLKITNPYHYKKMQEAYRTLGLQGENNSLSRNVERVLIDETVINALGGRDKHITVPIERLALRKPSDEAASVRINDSTAIVLCEWIDDLERMHQRHYKTGDMILMYNLLHSVDNQDMHFENLQYSQSQRKIYYLDGEKVQAQVGITFSQKVSILRLGGGIVPVFKEDIKQIFLDSSSSNLKKLQFLYMLSAGAPTSDFAQSIWKHISTDGGWLEAPAQPLDNFLSWLNRFVENKNTLNYCSPDLQEVFYAREVLGAVGNTHIYHLQELIDKNLITSARANMAKMKGEWKLLWKFISPEMKYPIPKIFDPLTENERHLDPNLTFRYYAGFQVLPKLPGQNNVFLPLDCLDAIREYGPLTIQEARRLRNTLPWREHCQRDPRSLPLEIRAYNKLS
jgi:hypothetical protein